MIPRKKPRVDSSVLNPQRRKRLEPVVVSFSQRLAQRLNFATTSRLLATTPPSKEVCVSLIVQIRDDESGATAIEYGLIAALISLACVIAFQTLGLNLVNVFTTIAAALG